MKASPKQQEKQISVADNAYLDLLKQCLTASLYDESSWAVIQNDYHPKRKYYKKKLKDWFFGALQKRNLMLVKRQPFDQAKREVGRDWPCFGYTMIGHRRLENVRECVEDVLKNNVPGDFIETGVWRGGTVIYMCALLKAYGVTDRTVWAADSFEGLPPPSVESDGEDISGVNYLKVSLEEVKANVERFGLLDDQVKFLKGWFSDTLPMAPIERLAVLRLDGDLYQSTMDALNGLYSRVSPGGYVIIDDYYSWDSCRQAVTDFLAENNLNVDIRTIDRDGAYWKVP